MKKLLVEILACVSLAACAVQPATHADLPATVNQTAPAGWSVDVPRESADPAAWWQQFGDPVLHDLVASVLNDNLDLQAAIERVKQAESLTTQEIANRLSVEPVTVRTHVSSILKKLDVTSRSEALKLLRR